MKDQKSKPQRWIRKLSQDKKRTCVYGLIDPRDQSLFWVGITNAPDLRYDQHLGRDQNRPGKDNSNPGKQKLMEEIIASGNQPGMVIIEEFDTREAAYNLEQNLTAFLFGVKKIHLKAIECRADKNWAFKPRLKAERQGLPWQADERLVLIGLYKKGTPAESIQNILQRSQKSVWFELFRAEKAGFLSIRDQDRDGINKAVQDSKHVRNLDDKEKEVIAAALYKIGTKYAELNADHMRLGFMPKKN